MKVLISVLLIISCASISFEETPSEEIYSFIQGFITGAGNGSGQCSSTVSTLQKTMIQTVSDILSYEQGQYLPILSDLNKLKLQFGTLSLTCDFEGFVQALNRLSGPNGKSILMRNYLSHATLINQQLLAIETCSSNFNLCGQSAGTIFRVLSGWTLSQKYSYEKNLELQAYNLLEFIEGAVDSIEWHAPTMCQDFFEVMPKATEAYEEIVSILNSNSQESVEYLEVLLSAALQSTSINDCFLAVGGIAFYHIPSAIGNWQAWHNLFYSNNKEIITLFKQISHSCSEDLSTCGGHFGRLLNLLVENSF